MSLSFGRPKMEVAMFRSVCVLVCGVALGFIGLACNAPVAEQKEKKELSNKDKLIGAWELTKAGNGFSPGAIFEFTKDGKLIITLAGDKDSMVGSYSVDGDTITRPEGQDPYKKTIKKLTETELVTEDESGQVDEFKRKKK